MEKALTTTPPMSEWGLGLPDGPVWIAGPCSAETEDQVLATARGLAATGIHMFRAGIWKPRTRPGCFEGVGSDGLPWLKKVKAETGLPIAIEVANVKHVYEAMRAGIDVVWIGARTTVNPFAVQEVADALKGVDIPVMVKNPVSPDLELWMGAMERLAAVGIKKIAALHRGFKGAQKSAVRNEPMWQVPIELRRRLPNLPIICDPSHITGRRDLIAEVSQQAMDLDFDGLMIESHCKPEEAWSDASQQMTPAALGKILADIIIREPEAKDEDFKLQVSQLRTQLDQLDNDLINLLSDRMAIVEKIGLLKKKSNVTVLQASRWDETLKHVRRHGEEHGFDEAFVDTLFKTIHQESINRQEKILKK